MISSQFALEHILDKLSLVETFSIQVHGREVERLFEQSEGTPVWEIPDDLTSAQRGHALTDARIKVLRALSREDLDCCRGHADRLNALIGSKLRQILPDKFAPCYEGDRAVFVLDGRQIAHVTVTQIRWFHRAGRLEPGSARCGWEISWDPASFEKQMD